MDGLAVYYTAGDSVWQATRNDVNSPFGNKKRLVQGRMPTLTADGLQMVLLRPGRLAKESLHVAKRSGTDKLFEEPTEIPEFSQQLAAKSPSLSADSLTLLFNLPKRTGRGVEIVLSTRKDTSSEWSAPKPVRITADRAIDTNVLLWPFLAADGQTLFVTQGGSIFVAEKQNDAPAFRIVGSVPLTGGPEFTIVRSPRYASESKELFFSGTTSQDKVKRWDLWVLKNYEP